jgi:hypothetical protein
MMRFFHTMAETVGRMKNGEIINTRAMPRPQNGWSNSSASAMPPTTVVTITPPTNNNVLMRFFTKYGSLRK